MMNGKWKTKKWTNLSNKKNKSKRGNEEWKKSKEKLNQKLKLKHKILDEEQKWERDNQKHK